MSIFIWIGLLLCTSFTLPSLAEIVNRSVECGELGDCISNNAECNKKCGCDTYSLVLVYNETTKECDLNIKQFLDTLQEKENTQAKIITEAENVFERIILSVVIVAACSMLCVLSACFYCFRINYTDNRLKKDIDALGAKLKRECRYKKNKNVQPTPHKAESCNIIVEKAGVYCI